MSLKIAVPLILAGLVAHSRGLGNDAAPGFTYTGVATDNQKLTMTASGGYFLFSYPMCNASAWSFTSGAGSNTITQDVVFPQLEAKYSIFEIAASHGAVDIRGISLTANLSKTKHKLSLTARKSGDQCKLEAKFSSPQMDVDVRVLGWTTEGKNFETPAVLEELQSVLAETLAGALPAYLTAKNPYPLPVIVEKDTKLCEMILKPKPWTLADPSINHDQCPQIH